MGVPYEPENLGSGLSSCLWCEPSGLLHFQDACERSHSIQKQGLEVAEVSVCVFPLLGDLRLHGVI